MKRVTLAELNRKLASLGYKERLARGDDHFVFVGGETSSWHNPRVLRQSIFDLTEEQWIAELNHLKKKNEYATCSA